MKGRTFVRPVYENKFFPGAAPQTYALHTHTQNTAFLHYRRTHSINPTQSDQSPELVTRPNWPFLANTRGLGLLPGKWKRPDFRPALWELNLSPVRRRRLTPFTHTEHCVFAPSASPYYQIPISPPVTRTGYTVRKSCKYLMT